MTALERTRVSVFVATSLDGYIARGDGSIDWLMAIEAPSEDEDYGYSEFVASVDMLVMGRKSFEKVLEFESWPYEMPVLVLTKSLVKVPERLEGKVTFDKASPTRLIERLTAEGIGHIYLDGGELIQSFLREDLIDDLNITRVPVLIGEGRPLFGTLEDDINLQIIQTRAWPNGLVQSQFEIIRDGSE